MLRKKELRVVVTFHTTTAAMQTEREARKHHIPGRLIPVPREISAGCGLAWSAPPEAEIELQTLFARMGIAPQEIHHITI